MAVSAWKARAGATRALGVPESPYAHASTGLTRATWQAAPSTRWCVACTRGCGKYLVDDRALAQQILRVGERAGRLAARKRGANPGQSHQGLPFFGAHRLFQEATTSAAPHF